MSFPSPLDVLRQAVLGRAALLTATAWVTVQHGVQQALRLGTNVVLARLLAPELLGTMLLINTLRTGGELLSDVGIGQSIVSHERGRDPMFFNTAWTIQIIRGALLFAIALLITRPLAELYDSPQLTVLLPVAALVFLISGFTSPSKFLLQKDMQVRRLALLGIAMAVSSSAIHIALAMYTPTIWALIFGLLLSTAGGTLASFFLLDWKMHAIRFDRKSARAIVGFGKWVFLSSLIYFAAMNFDRLYLAGAVPFALLGIYGIARTFADAITQLFLRISRMIIFPKVAAARDQISDLRRRVLPARRVVLCAMALGIAALVAVADEFIYLAYDPRYRAAGIYLPVLLVGAWFAILASIAEAMLLGIGKSSSMAFSNGAKFVIVVITVPLLLPTAGMLAATGALVLGEAARYAVLVWRKRAHGISFIRQDVAATALLLVAILAFRELTHLIGITGGIFAWVAEARDQLA